MMAKANFMNGTTWVGNNLEAPRGINSECVDLVYLSPLFNSSRNYAAPIESEAAGRGRILRTHGLSAM